MNREVRERLELAAADTSERIEHTKRDIVRAMAPSGGIEGRSWDSPVIRTHRARLASAMADIAILNTLLARNTSAAAGAETATTQPKLASPATSSQRGGQ
jgi:hypothetical protein